MKIFDSKTIKQRQKRATEALNRVLNSSELVLIFSGEPVQKPGGLDQTYPFIPHPDYYWLTGLRRPHGVAAYHASEGWVEFVKPVGQEERLWEGSRDEFQGRNIEKLAEWVSSLKVKTVFTLGQPTFKDLSLGTNQDPQLKLNVQEALNEVRRVKDEAEIRLIVEIAEMAHAGYQKIKRFIKPGVTERQIQIEYEHTVLKAGAEKFPYDTIVGAGVNAGILHAIPTSRVVKKNDLILIDAGADVADYCVDITRVFPAEKKFSSRQRQIYDLVHKAQSAAIKMSLPGVHWGDIHRKAAEVMADGLQQLGLLKGSVQDLLESGAISLFFPHGIGHMVGLKVRDVGGSVLKSPLECCGVRLRFNLPLQENFIVTVEPGLYFVPAILDRSDIRMKYKALVNWSEVERWKNFGGVRIEDDILIKSKGARNLTDVVEKL